MMYNVINDSRKIDRINILRTWDSYRVSASDETKDAV